MGTETTKKEALEFLARMTKAVEETEEIGNFLVHNYEEGGIQNFNFWITYREGAVE